MEHGVDGREARGEGEARQAPVELCDEALERSAGRIARTRVLPALTALAQAVLLEGRCQLDGHIDCAGCLVGGAAAVDKGGLDVLELGHDVVVFI